MKNKTIHGVSSELRKALIEYIEATYHIGDTALARQRRALLEAEGVVHQLPFIESTPRYQTGRVFSEIPGLNQAAVDVLECLAEPRADGTRALYNPPYTHQSAAIKTIEIDRRSAVIMTGTGSGKTESFLMPILARLAREAASSRGSFGTSGVRSMILYPMNALVNDQLTRLRALFGDDRVNERFTGWAGRPPRFARYTSRTPYAGVRDARKDQRILKPFRKFYIDALETAAQGGSQGAKAEALVHELKARGKWPSKKDLRAWYGNDNSPWQDADGRFLRAVTRVDDAELLTRHESQAAAPDLVVTNYSMLEYMLMRPVEATIFDQTRTWLANNPEESFLLILDEAHLYRGSAGAEVGLLLRRLRDRLGISIDRFQVICATASFSDQSKAPDFASKLSGLPSDVFDVIPGDYRYRLDPRTGSADEANLLEGIDLSAFYDEDPHRRSLAIAPFLASRGIVSSGSSEIDLYKALDQFGPLSELINFTMKRARPVDDLGSHLFPKSDRQTADRAVTALSALATNARMNEHDASLLPCRVHTFFRGLRGLWVCLDSQCSEVDDGNRGILGKLYSQPRELCDCGARVLELFTCRHCGTPFARAYCENPSDPRVLWREPGAALRLNSEDASELQPLDILFTPAAGPGLVDEIYFDIVTGLVGTKERTSRARTVYIAREDTALGHAATNSDEDDDADGSVDIEPGRFARCPSCRHGAQERSPVQDHETKGDQPFQVLVSKQIQLQPPSPRPATSFAPLRGRKVLVFSDSRQVAARLAPNIQTLSSRDSLRSLVAFGWRRLSAIDGLDLDLRDLCAAVLVAASRLGVRLRPELRPGDEFRSYEEVAQKISSGAYESDHELKMLCIELRSADAPPEAFVADLVIALRNRAFGLEPLAIASIVERRDKRGKILDLPHIPGVTENDQDKLELARAWIREWQHTGFWLNIMPERWKDALRTDKLRVGTRKVGGFQRLLGKLPSPASRRVFKDQWIPKLLELFATRITVDYRLSGPSLSLSFDGSWVRCSTCKSVHRPVRLLRVCLDCGSSDIFSMDPQTDELFGVRKGYYRRAVLEVLGDDPVAPMTLVAAEHTAQLNSSQFEDAFSKAEVNELLFQDVELPSGDEAMPRTAIDILSSTTTMEVGIDIGQLSGVALRNMPPGRANYQQRAGRAGRRGNAIATVVAFGGSDTHDEHFFSRPKEMIAGEVNDPTLSLENADIARRHVRAFLLQTYMQDRIASGAAIFSNELFSVLGNVVDFRTPGHIPGRMDLEAWLIDNEVRLRGRVESWLPAELTEEDKQAILGAFSFDLLREVDGATAYNALADADADGGSRTAQETGGGVGVLPAARPADADDGMPDGLLDALLFKGVLPRYAFPTDVTTFHVFDKARSTTFRPVFEYTPSQGAALALTQYAPGKQVWVGGKCYESGAIYTPYYRDRIREWREHKLYAECGVCGYIELNDVPEQGSSSGTSDCPACGTASALREKRWFRPLGFAHPINLPPLVSPEDIPEVSYATRAKLTMTLGNSIPWVDINERMQAVPMRTHLLVSNSGPRRRGYNYCVSCGRIEAVTTSEPVLTGPHRRPAPDSKEEMCLGRRVAQSVVLGTEFITDVSLFSIDLAPSLRLLPGDTVTHIAMRTLAEAMSRGASHLLEIEPGEIAAEYRPANSPRGRLGYEAELFLYDTLSGGAGYSRAAVSKGVALLQAARQVLSSCQEGCDSSCYRCLRNFRNRQDHSLLDRHVGLSFIDFLLTGKLSPFDGDRLRVTTRLLTEDLRRQKSLGLSVTAMEPCADMDGEQHEYPLQVTDEEGRSLVVAVVNPLKLSYPERLSDAGGAKRLLCVGEILVRSNLGEVTRLIRGTLLPDEEILIQD